MKSAFGSLAGVMLLAATAVGQINLPAHNNVYNGFSRGFQFVAQSSFNITQLELPTDAFQAGDTGSYLLYINGAVAFYQTGVAPGGNGAATVAANVLVTQGDDVSVIGNWSPAVPGNFTAHNSYATGGGTYTTQIEGQTTTLNRVGWQWDIGDPNYTTGAYLAPTSGSMGRILVYTAPAAGFASKSQYGNGCIDDPFMEYEKIPTTTSPIDLVNTSYLIALDATNNRYTITAGGAPAYDSNFGANAVDLALGAYTSSSSASWDDASVIMTPSNSIMYPAPGGPGTATELTINSNGKLYFGSTTDGSFATNGSNYGSTDPFQGVTGAGLPNWCAFNVDLDPLAGGQIMYEDPSPNGGVRITWHDIPNWQDPAGPAAVVNNIQIEFVPGGLIFLAFGNSLGNGGSTPNDVIVGYSAGGGEPLNTPIDWSAITTLTTGNGAVPLTFDADARPVMGTSINLVVDNVPAASPSFAAVVLSVNQAAAGIPLNALGMPGCNAYVGTLDFLTGGLAAGSTFSTPLAIPATPNFAGVMLYSQALAINPGIPNAFQGITSNGLELVIDMN